MNIVLWISQGLVAFLYLTGGYYKTFHFDELANSLGGAVSPGAWRAIGLLEMSCAVLLIVPAALKWMPVLTPVAAAVLTLETVALAAIYARHSLALSVSNPLVWSIVMGVLVAFVAYGRFAITPPA
jgi:hypothetical protein